MRTRSVLTIFLCSLCCGLSVGVASVHADPETKSCGKVRKASDLTIRLDRVAGMSCKTARNIARAPSNSKGRVRGHGSFFYTASDCEGVIWRRYEFEYSQENEGELPDDGKFIGYSVTIGCNS